MTRGPPDREQVIGKATDLRVEHKIGDFAVPSVLSDGQRHSVGEQVRAAEDERQDPVVHERWSDRK